jgi:hypothetical protein
MRKSTEPAFTESTFAESTFADEIRAARRYERWLLAKAAVALLIVTVVAVLHQLVPR